MFEYFYHEILRKTVIGFGTLFNSITIKHKNNENEVISAIKVPLAYGPTQKFLARLEQVPDLNKPVQMSLPRMSFELIGLSYDNSRKLTTTQTFTTKDVNNNIQKKAYLPVPYNLNFELSIMTKLNDDMLQIIEQILPYFQPNYNITVDLVEQIGEKRDIPVTLDNISMTDNYEGDYTERRALIYTLKFTAKTYIFGPISSDDVSKDVIKKVSIGFIAGESGPQPKRDITYKIEPRSIKNYSNNVISILTSDITIDATTIQVSEPENIPINSYIEIADEEMYVVSKSSNILSVRRGQDNTRQISHISGEEVKLITSTDSQSIIPGDDFGFDSTIM